MNEEVHPADLPAEKLLSQCEIKFQRRGGPGGQHRNKVETAVVLTHTPTGITSEANEQRSQAANRQEAIFRLRLKLAIQVRSHARQIDTAGVSPLWKSRVRAQKISVAATHDDFPALLAEALDWLVACEFDVKQCAERLGTTSSQFVRFLKLEPECIVMVNRQRASRNLRPLR